MANIARRGPYDRQLWGDRVRSLTLREELALATAIRSGTEAEAEAARETLATCNLPWCRVVASRMARRHGVDSDDCFGAAQLGLLHAIRSYDPGRGVRFLTHAHRHIVSAIQLNALPYRLAVSTPTYMVKGCSMNPENYAKAAAWESCMSLDAPTGEQAGPFSEVVSDRRDDFAALAEADHRDRTLARLGPAMRRLAPRERAVIRLRYPLDGSRRLGLVEAGARLGVSREMVRLIEVAALAKLRDSLERGRPSAATA